MLNHYVFPLKVPVGKHWLVVMKNKWQALLVELSSVWWLTVMDIFQRKCLIEGILTGERAVNCGVCFLCPKNFIKKALVIQATIIIQ